MPPVILVRPEETETSFLRRRMAQLIMVGGRLAVLGVSPTNPSRSKWHVVRPGSYDTPIGHAGLGVDGFAYGRGMCGRIVLTNGYAADWRPPQGDLCPACAERL